MTNSYEELEARLREPLPVCPFDRRSPDYWTTGNDGKPCHVCGGTEDGPDLCRGADTRVMDEAADALADLRKRLEELRDELSGARQSLIEADREAERLKGEVERLTHLSDQGGVDQSLTPTLADYTRVCRLAHDHNREAERLRKAISDRDPSIFKED